MSADPAEALADPAQEARAQAIGRELRCLVCQGQSIEDSNAIFAVDMRRAVRERIAGGDTDRQVMDWVTARYGDMVRLRPPVSAGTAMLWASPVIFVAAGLATALLLRRRRRAAVAPLTEAEKARIAALRDG